MNVTKLTAAVATLVAVGSVFAQEYVQPDAGFVSARSRAEVNAELAQARTSSTPQAADYAYPVVTVALTKSRGDVTGELAQARNAGSLQWADHEYPVVQASSKPRTRDEVRAELATVQGNSGIAFQPTNH